MSEEVRERAGRFMALAAEALEDARAAAERGSDRNCLNRSYYAAFYAASALITARDFHSSKHRGVLSIFDREFVLKDLMSREHGRALHRLFELRGDADVRRVSGGAQSPPCRDYLSHAFSTYTGIRRAAISPSPHSTLERITRRPR